VSSYLLILSKRAKKREQASTDKESKPKIDDDPLSDVGGYGLDLVEAQVCLCGPSPQSPS
jgi:hypothetical protein